LSSDPRQTHIIANNLLVDQGVEGISFNNFIYNYGGLGDGDNEIRFLIYNNILVGRRVATSQGGIAVGRLNNTYPISLYILNNTIIVKVRVVQVQHLSLLGRLIHSLSRII
jgi:hypothetical protein